VLLSYTQVGPVFEGSVLFDTPFVQQPSVTLTTWNTASVCSTTAVTTTGFTYQCAGPDPKYVNFIAVEPGGFTEIS
jgi:hypothetical protein